ncbi:MAG: hypothetical protein Q8Q60_04215 [Candidatus Chromulinivorax sp.]|nr:hypothetical protein [Candidatus Chromulinivorax sp.]
MLFLIIIFFYVSHSFASQDYTNSATLKLTNTLYKIISPAAHSASTDNELIVNPLYLTSEMQNLLITCIQKHFHTHEDYDVEHNKKLACTFFEQFSSNYQINDKQKKYIRKVLDEQSYDCNCYRQALYPVPQVMREQSGETDRESFTIGSYESTYSIMSAQSPRSKTRSVSFDPSIPENK